MKYLLPIMLLFTFSVPCFAVEGMFPLNDIHTLDLHQHGFEISADAIYNPDGISLIDGICKVNGCTGSFISDDGLILTNHHCAFRTVQMASTNGHDYITSGYVASNRTEEFPAAGYAVRITKWYRDVTADVLSAVTETMRMAERTRAIDKRRNEIITRVEHDYPGHRAEIAEMFIGKTYVLFVYIYLKDVRLVYAPPRSIGEFGGEIDNWMWPRHSGDFSLMRAYVAPDGTPADYAPTNVPYHPKTRLTIQPDGVNTGDLVFLIGYPGRTYRHQTSDFPAYEQEVRMPFVVDWYQWQIDMMNAMGQSDRTIALKHASRIKSLSNTMKNYRGKLKGINREHLIARRRKEEAALQKYIMDDANRAAQYGTVQTELADIYSNVRTHTDRTMILHYLNKNVTLLNIAYTLYEAAVERQKPDVERKADYTERNFGQTKQKLEQSLHDFYQPTDQQIFNALIAKATTLLPDQHIAPIDSIMEAYPSIDEFLDTIYHNTTLTNADTVRTLFIKTPEQLTQCSDPFVQLARHLYPLYAAIDNESKSRKGATDQLYAKLYDVKAEFLKQKFIPDANGTLRLTFGQINGYSPNDAVWCQPITTVTGILEKDTGQEPFNSPSRLLDLIHEKKFGKYVQPKLSSVPCCILYDTDTTGGNSGSPVFNAHGELVGLNFDRTYEATINDYAWSENYSRSIGVDIRYILWILDEYEDVDYLLTEMGVN
ncbi:S46 family peptidase [candidate division KSB1 bacterium]|nr:S46 family peptidase [candidate division KSB1 bacterium]